MKLWKDFNFNTKRDALIEKQDQHNKLTWIKKSTRDSERREREKLAENKNPW